MKTIAIIILIYLVLVLFYQIILSIRNEHVYNYRIKVSDEDYERGIEMIKEGTYSEFERKYNKLPSYDTMVRYFWIPLTDENWVGFTTLKDYYKRKNKKS
ncbi:MAG: hypothetical protein EGP82_00075 [Odoribacter splanchnicus]|nr:hypothetical protein [Odoribacter splanchnicus]